MKVPSKVGPRLGAVMMMFFGCALVFGSILMMNKPLPPPKKENVRSIMSMQVEKKRKTPERRRPEKAQRKVKSSDAARAPLPDLSSGVTNADLGIPSMDVGQVMGLAENAVGAASAKSLVMTEDSVDVSPRPMRRTSPTYPPRARAKSIEGYVTLRVLIGVSGQVEKVKIEDSSPTGVFDEAAVEAVSGWSFEPALYRGEKVRVWAKQTVRFNLG